MKFTLAHLMFILVPGVQSFMLVYMGTEDGKYRLLRAMAVGIFASFFVFLYWYSLFGRLYIK